MASFKKRYKLTTDEETLRFICVKLLSEIIGLYIRDLKAKLPALTPQEIKDKVTKMSKFEKQDKEFHDFLLELEEAMKPTVQVAAECAKMETQLENMKKSGSSTDSVTFRPSNRFLARVTKSGGGKPGRKD